MKKHPVTRKAASILAASTMAAGLLAGAVDKTACPKEGTLPAQAVFAARGYEVARQGAVVYLERVDVVVVALLDERKQGREAGRLGNVFALHVYGAHAPFAHAFHAAPAGVVRKAFEAGEVQFAQGPLEQGQFALNKLVEQGICLGGHANAHLVFLGGQGSRDQVGKGLPYPRAGFDHKVFALFKGGRNELCHFDLF